MWANKINLFSHTGFTSQATNVTVTFMAKHHTVGDEYYFFFMCLSNDVPLGCSVEFLKNNTTLDNLRLSSNDHHCYHKTGGVCNGDECACSSDCMNFTLKYAKTEIRTSDIFSCKMRIQEQEGIWTDIYDYAVFDGRGKIIYLYSFPHLWFITGYVTRVTQLVPLVEQELVTRLEFTSGF
jgi:hypothetical protein